MTTSASNSQDGNTERTSTFDALSEYYERAKYALRSPPTNGLPGPAPLSTPPPPERLSFSLSNSSTSPHKESPSAGETDNACGKPKRAEALRLPWWWTFIAIIGSSMIATFLTYRSNASRQSAAPSLEIPAAHPPAIFWAQQDSLWVLSFPNQGLFLLRPSRNGTLEAKTENGWQRMSSLATPAN